MADPEFWNELTINKTHNDLPDSNTTVVEDAIEAPGDFDDYGDDSSISVSAVISDVLKGGAGRESRLVPKVLAEDEDAEPVETIDMEVDLDQIHDTDSHALSPVVGRSSADEIGVSEITGKRKRTANRWYALKSFIRHNDDEGSEVDM